jgi:ElaB/YqjD/DUF883 family membrane-anchored ribosome-binding protein
MTEASAGFVGTPLASPLQPGVRTGSPAQFRFFHPVAAAWATLFLEIIIMAINPTTPGFETAAAAENAVNRAAQSAHAMVDRVAEKAGPTVERVRSGINSASETLETGVEHFGEMQDRWLEDCRGCVRDHPLASVGLAVAVGVLLSRLMGR